MSKKYFKAIGQQYASRGIVFARVGAIASWPDMPQWAIDAVMQGNIEQASTGHRRWIEQRCSELAAESMRRKS